MFHQSQTRENDFSPGASPECVPDTSHSVLFDDNSSIFSPAYLLEEEPKTVLSFDRSENLTAALKNCLRVYTQLDVKQILQQLPEFYSGSPLSEKKIEGCLFAQKNRVFVLEPSSKKWSTLPEKPEDFSFVKEPSKLSKKICKRKPKVPIQRRPDSNCQDTIDCLSQILSTMDPSSKETLEPFHRSSVLTGNGQKVAEELEERMGSQRFVGFMQCFYHLLPMFEARRKRKVNLTRVYQKILRDSDRLEA